MIKIIRCDENEVMIMLDQDYVYYLKQPVTTESRVIVALVERIKELEAEQSAGVLAEYIRRYATVNEVSTPTT